MQDFSCTYLFINSLKRLIIIFVFLLLTNYPILWK